MNNQVRESRSVIFSIQHLQCQGNFFLVLFLFFLFSSSIGMVNCQCSYFPSSSIILVGIRIYIGSRDLFEKIGLIFRSQPSYAQQLVVMLSLFHFYHVRKRLLSIDLFEQTEFLFLLLIETSIKVCVLNTSALGQIRICCFNLAKEQILVLK